MSEFTKLGVHDSFIKSLEESDISTPTTIQKEVIPYLIKSNSDLIGQAQTGSGKTIAFSLPLLHKIDHLDPSIQALILAPTRELCKQIAKQIFRLTKYSVKIFSESVYGGEKIDIQIRNLRRPTHILVATPGRLIDLLDREALSLEQVKTVILDEADEMLSMGFKKELNNILDRLNTSRSTWLFSATMPKEIDALIKKHLSADAKIVKVKIEEKINARIEHQFLTCENSDKPRYLHNFIKFQGEQRGIIFCRTKASVKKLHEVLTEKNINVGAIHGDLSQSERDKAMRMFRKQTTQLLVATDISARGIDVKDLAYVVHYELPDQLEYYTHRSGRTARAGKKGISLAFVQSAEIKRLRIIEKKLGIRFRNI